MTSRNNEHVRSGLDAVRASQGVGAGIAAAFAAADYPVVGTALSAEPSATPDVLMAPGDIAQAETAEREIATMPQPLQPMQAQMARQ
jgi:hypothetical protein